jgi:APA family basic amino acid/polyamine antiporter
MASQLFRKKQIHVILREAEEGLSDAEGHAGGLRKVLGVRDLTAMGIAAVIGAGIFSSIGKACFDGGPGVIFLYIFTAIACGFAALCYAEFASTVPVSGSAYTYSYVAFGEIFAWIIGWDLLMEYAIGNIAVAISWSDYFTGLLDKAGMVIPRWLTMDYTTAHNGFLAVSQAVKGAAVDPTITERALAWTSAPTIGGLHLIFDLPALLIVALITRIVFIGIKESRSASNIMVGIKLAVIFLVIVLGAYYAHPENWTPFTPNGMSGVLKGVSAVFFAYIGFDAISTTAEECKNPQRDLPRGMIYSLIICTILYVLLALVLTGMVPYTMLNVGDPLALIFEARNMPWISGIVGVSAVVATASVLLVFQLGQPRIWMAMSRDGLLPKVFSRLHPKYKTPSFSTIVTGLAVAIPAMFLNLDVVLALTSIGTLFAFVLVCAGVLVLQRQKNKPESKFKVPYVNGRYIIPIAFVIALIAVYKGDAGFVTRQANMRPLTEAGKPPTIEFINNSGYAIDSAQASVRFQKEDKSWHELPMVFTQVKANDTLYYNNPELTGTSHISVENKQVRSSSFVAANPGPRYFKSLFNAEKFPMALFWVIVLITVVLTFVHSFSLIPVMGFTSCFYLMAQEHHSNWLRFLIWLAVGLVVYFAYGYRNSRLNKETIAGAGLP